VRTSETCAVWMMCSDSLSGKYLPHNSPDDVDACELNERKESK